MDNKVGFSYGVLYESLEEQSNKQDYTLGKDANTFEQIREAINMCMFHVATDSQVSTMTKKLHKKVIKALKPISIQNEGK